LQEIDFFTRKQYNILMVITWYGQSCFKIQSGDLVIAIDPFSKDIGLTPPRFRADIALITHDHADHNNLASLSGEPFAITGPGEYETKGVYIRGIPTFHDNARGDIRGLNTMYLIDMEHIRVVHMGDFGEDALREETSEIMGTVDILLIPVGGHYTIDAEQAARMVKDMEPRYVIPMHYKLPYLKAALADRDEFLKEMGARSAEVQEKFTIKKKDIIAEEKTEVVVLGTA